jgi:hypothetical protein
MTGPPVTGQSYQKTPFLHSLDPEWVFPMSFETAI